MKAIVDPELCTGCGLCPDICPSVFEMNDDGIAESIIAPVPVDDESSCREAADSCPAEAIVIED